MIGEDDLFVFFSLDDADYLPGYVAEVLQLIDNMQKYRNTQGVFDIVAAPWSPCPRLSFPSREVLESL